MQINGKNRLAQWANNIFFFDPQTATKYLLAALPNEGEIRRVELISALWTFCKQRNKLRAHCVQPEPPSEEPLYNQRVLSRAFLCPCAWVKRRLLWPDHGSRAGWGTGVLQSVGSVLHIAAPAESYPHSAAWASYHTNTFQHSFVPSCLANNCSGIILSMQPLYINPSFTVFN